MKCLCCGKDFIAKRSTAKYCGSKCRKIAFQSDAKNTVLDVTVPVMSYELVEGETVYGRPAVKYALKEAWATRPKPDSPNDIPVKDNRGRYITPDGVAYQIDATGRRIDSSWKNGGLPANFGLENCECLHCRANKSSGNKHIINHGIWKPASKLAANELNRHSLPGDVDYVGVCNA